MLHTFVTHLTLFFFLLSLLGAIGVIVGNLGVSLVIYRYRPKYGWDRIVDDFMLALYIGLAGMVGCLIVGAIL